MLTPKMEKAAWIDAFAMHMTELGVTSVKLGQLAETLWPHLGNVDPKTAALAEHALWDASKDGFPDTEFDAGS